MNWKKLIFISISLGTIIVLLYIQREKDVKSTKENICIGILQIASHPALDAARDSFIQELQEKMESDVEFVIQNAQGSIANAHMIAQRFHNDALIKGIYAIATPSAQSITMVEKEKPIFIAAVTDSSILGNQNNVFGVCDMINMQKEIAMIRDFFPKIQNIAVIYSNAEANSIAQVQEIKKECVALNIGVFEIGISQESDLSSAMAIACRKGDVILCPTDNMIASAMELIVSIAHTYKKPLFACHNQAVEQGALAARGVNYNQCGKRVGEIACDLFLNGKINSDLPIEQAKTNTVYVNKQALQYLNLIVPESLGSDVILLETKE